MSLVGPLNLPKGFPRGWGKPKTDGVLLTPEDFERAPGGAPGVPKAPPDASDVFGVRADLERRCCTRESREALRRKAQARHNLMAYGTSASLLTGEDMAPPEPEAEPEAEA